MAPKLWRESYSAKGMHALIDYHRSDILPSNVERLWVNIIECHVERPYPSSATHNLSNINTSIQLVVSIIMNIITIIAIYSCYYPM